jgi:hypothetical protein
VGRHLAALAPEIIVVDNASSDGSADMVSTEFPGVKLRRNPENLGFGLACNQGMNLASRETVLLLNSDAWLESDSLAGLVRRLRERPDVGIAGPRLLHEDGTLQPSAYRFESLGLRILEELAIYKSLPRSRQADLLLGGYWAHDSEREVDWLVGACLLMRRAVFEQTGGFDSSIFLYGEEEELCWRTRRAGWQVLFSPIAEVTHVGHESARQLLGDEGRLHRCLAASDQLVARWHGPAVARLAGGTRVLGAVIRLAYFTVRDALGRKAPHTAVAMWTARAVLSHYLRCRGGTGAPSA